MSKSRVTTLALTLLLATGAGCFGLGGSNEPAPASGGVWLSDNNGSTWVAKSALPLPASVSSINGLDILALEQDPSDASAVYLGSKTSGLFYSLDSGESWARPEEKLAASGAVLAVEVDPRDVCTYYVLKTDRLLKTTSCGREFDVETYVETRTDEFLTSMALDWYSPNTVLLGTTQGDILRSQDGGETWAAIFRAKNAIVDLEISNADSRIILAGTSSKGIYRTTDGGAIWVDSATALKPYSKSDKVYSLSQTESGDRILLRSGYGLLFSDDSGTSWQNINLVTSAGEVVVTAAEISPVNKNIMYYASGATFYTSTSGGTAWSTTNLPSSRAASVIHVNQGNPDQVFLGVRSVE
ncbi:MAG: hypothetical protein WAZ14_04565 [Patescibacteria group bacterium]